MNALAHRLSVAPMMDWTDRHCRYFLRLLAPHALLYTEMIATGAILRGNRPLFLDFDPAEHPVALQLGGADPRDLAESARRGAEWGYDSINLNCGCPSDRVQAARFGACLMAEPAHVAACVAAMAEAAQGTEITVKCRVGIEPSPDPARDDYDLLCEFVGKVSEAGARTIALHARKAVLAGLSPKENREIPPLSYETGYRLKRDFPQLTLVLNGGIETVAAIRTHLSHLDGVMLGRVAYQDPYRLAEIEADLFGTPLPSRHAVIEAMLPFIAGRLAAGAPLNAVTRHILGLFQGLPGARRWRRILSEEACRSGAGLEVVRKALAAISREIPDEAAA